MKSLGDAIDLRNTLIARLEEANPDCVTKNREPLLTFVVAGGGFAGVETVGSIKDFLHDALPYYPNLKPEIAVQTSVKLAIDVPSLSVTSRGVTALTFVLASS
jgi:NADH dehydrogenase